MKVFISWSGLLSKEIAEEIRIWLPGVLQAVKPYYTPDDIEKGARWSSEIALELEDSKVGIFCLTRENLQSSWIQFEAGAISKVVESGAVCPILFGIDNSDVSGPLGQFQSTLFNKKDMFKLIQVINNEIGDGSLAADTLKSVFEKWWPELESKVERLLDTGSDSHQSELRSDREVLEEILGLVRLESKERKPNIVLSETIPGINPFLKFLYAQNYEKQKYIIADDLDRSEDMRSVQEDKPESK